MNIDLDSKLISAFTSTRVKQEFAEYKFAKWDHFSSISNPTINIPVGADGITLKGFRKQIDRNAVNISERVRNGTYIFYALREEDKEKEPKRTPPEFRPISIASIRDVIVQNILYKDIIHDVVEGLFATLDKPHPVSYGYRKGKSAGQAAKAVHAYIQDGYIHVLDADLTNYFNCIKHKELLERITSLIGSNNPKTFKLIYRFIHTDKVPHKTYRYIRGKKNQKLLGYRVFHRIKPQRETREAGVPQGGVISGMLANLYLHDFDEWVVNQLGSEIDLKYVRYADDFIVLVKNPEDLSLIRKRVDNFLTKPEYELTLSPKKTKEVNVLTQGIDFVGFHFDGKEIRARDNNIDRFKKRIKKDLDKIPEWVKKKNDSKTALRWMVQQINRKVLGFSQNEICPKCGYERISSPRSWMAFFQVITQIEQIKALDLWLRQEIYNRIFQMFHRRVRRKDLRTAGLKSLVNQWYGISQKRLYPCLCDIKVRGVLSFCEDIYKGKTFTTLKGKRPFYIKAITEQEIILFVNGHESRILKKVIEDLWQQLLNGSKLSRVQLEKQGYRNTSQIVSLLAHLPGIVFRTTPISLRFAGSHPAPFMAV